MADVTRTRPLTSRCGNAHAVQLYESEDFLAETVGRFLAAGLRTGDAAVVIATEEHRRAFSAAVVTCGVDAEQAVRCRQLIMLDAAATLRAFMTPAGPDAGRFAATIGTVLDGAAGDGRPVRAYGEMVALLWHRGAVASAMGLEQLWNDLATERDFSLLCAYPLDLFADPGAARDFARMCEQHTRVLPSGDRSLLEPTDIDSQRRAVAALQQQLAAVRSKRRSARTNAAGPEGRSSRRTAGEEPSMAGLHEAAAGIMRGKRAKSSSHGRRLLGLCAHCGQPVSHDERYIRLYRRAWHVECALKADGWSDRPV